MPTNHADDSKTAPIESPAPANPQPMPVLAIEPAVLPDPKKIVRGTLGMDSKVAQYAITILLILGGAGLCGWIAWQWDGIDRILGIAGTALATVALVRHWTAGMLQWIELEGNTIRSQSLYGRKIDRQPLSIVADLQDHQGEGDQQREHQLILTLQGRILAKAYYFRNGYRPIHVWRFKQKMVRGNELLDAMLLRFAPDGKIPADMVADLGLPPAPTEYWLKRSAMREQRGLPWLYMLVMIAILSGALLHHALIQDLALQQWADAPATPMSLQQLLSDGPGEHGHLHLRDFLPGMTYTSSRIGNGQWNSILVEFLPEDANTKTPVQVVMHSTSVSSPQELNRQLNRGWVNVICLDKNENEKQTEEIQKTSPFRPIELKYVLMDVNSVPSAEELSRRKPWPAVAFGAAMVLSGVILFHKVKRAAPISPAKS